VVMGLLSMLLKNGEKFWRIWGVNTTPYPKPKLMAMIRTSQGAGLSVDYCANTLHIVHLRKW